MKAINQGLKGIGQWIQVKGAAEAIAFITERSKPLAFYVFTTDKTIAQLMVSEVSAGGIVVNDTCLQVCEWSQLIQPFLYSSQLNLPRPPSIFNPPCGDITSSIYNHNQNKFHLTKKLDLKNSQETAAHSLWSLLNVLLNSLDFSLSHSLWFQVCLLEELVRVELVLTMANFPSTHSATTRQFCTGKKLETYMQGTLHTPNTNRRSSRACSLATSWVPLFSFLVGGSKSWDQRRRHATLLLQKKCEQQASTQHWQSTNYCAESLLNEQSNPRKSFCYSNVCLDFLLLFNPIPVTRGILTH